MCFYTRQRMACGCYKWGPLSHICVDQAHDDWIICYLRFQADIPTTEVDRKCTTCHKIEDAERNLATVLEIQPDLNPASVASWRRQVVDLHITVKSLEATREREKIQNAVGESEREILYNLKEKCAEMLAVLQDY